MLYENVIDHWTVQIQDWLAPIAHLQSLTFNAVESINQIHLDRLTDIVEENIDQVRDVLFFHISPSLPELLNTQMDRLTSVTQTLDSDLESITRVSNHYLKELNELATKNLNEIQRVTHCINPLACRFDNVANDSMAA